MNKYLNRHFKSVYTRSIQIIKGTQLYLDIKKIQIEITVKYHYIL